MIGIDFKAHLETKSGSLGTTSQGAKVQADLELFAIGDKDRSIAAFNLTPQQVGKRLGKQPGKTAHKSPGISTAEALQVKVTNAERKERQ